MKIHTHAIFSWAFLGLLGFNLFRPIIVLAIFLGSAIPDIDCVDTRLIQISKRFWLIDKLFFLLFIPLLFPIFLTEYFTRWLQNLSFSGFIEGFRDRCDIFFAMFKKSPGENWKSFWASKKETPSSPGRKEYPKETQEQEEESPPLWKMPYLVLRILIFNIQPWEERPAQEGHSETLGRKEEFERSVAQHLPFHLSFIKFSDYLEDRWGHRTITHSLFFYLILSLCLWPFVHFFPYLKTPFVALVSALFLHSLLDTQNIAGVYFWYPFNIIAVFPAVQEQRFRSGGFRDHLYLWHFLILLIPVLITTKIGCVRTIHLMAKQPWCAVQDYLVMADDHRVVVQLPDAREIQTNRYISGNLLAVGTPDNLSLIVEDKDHYKYLIGQAPWATLAVRSVVAQEGIPVVTRTERIKMENKPMSDLISILKTKGDECRLSGYMRLAYQAKHLPLPNYPSIKTSGHFFQFVLADVHDIERFGLAESYIISADIKLRIVDYQSKDFKYQIARVERGEDL